MREPKARPHRWRNSSSANSLWSDFFFAVHSATLELELCASRTLRKLSQFNPVKVLDGGLAMKKVGLLLTALLFVAACNSGKTSDQAADTGSSTQSASNTKQTAPDNTAVNAIPRGKIVTAKNQATGSKADVKTTRRIRRALVADRSLSTYGKNVKVVTVKGKVTLKGPVKSDREKMVIAEKAQRIAGAGKVDNELNVSRQ